MGWSDDPLQYLLAGTGGEDGACDPINNQTCNFETGFIPSGGTLSFQLTIQNDCVDPGPEVRSVYGPAVIGKLPFGAIADSFDGTITFQPGKARHSDGQIFTGRLPLSQESSTGSTWIRLSDVVDNGNNASDLDTNYMIVVISGGNGSLFTRFSSPGDFDLAPGDVQNPWQRKGRILRCTPCWIDFHRRATEQRTIFPF